MPVKTETFRELWAPLVHTNFGGKSYGPIIGPCLFLGTFVWTNGPESSSKVLPYTGIGPGMALPSTCEQDRAVLDPDQNIALILTGMVLLLNHNPFNWFSSPILLMSPFDPEEPDLEAPKREPKQTGIKVSNLQKTKKKNLPFWLPSVLISAQTGTEMPSLTCLHADFGKEYPSRTSWKGQSWNCPSPTPVLWPLLYRTEHF